MPPKESGSNVTIDIRNVMTTADFLPSPSILMDSLKLVIISNVNYVYFPEFARSTRI